MTATEELPTTAETQAEQFLRSSTPESREIVLVSILKELIELNGGGRCLIPFSTETHHQPSGFLDCNTASSGGPGIDLKLLPDAAWKTCAIASASIRCLERLSSSRIKSARNSGNSSAIVVPKDGGE